jgi:ferredoxin
MPTCPSPVHQPDATSHGNHAHCQRCGACLAFAPAERITCADCTAAERGTDVDYSANNVAALARLHAARALALGPLHPELARPLALGRWEGWNETFADEVTARLMKRYYVDAFIAEVQAAAG